MGRVWVRWIARFMLLLVGVFVLIALPARAAPHSGAGAFARAAGDTVVAWGYNNGGQTDVPGGLSGVVQVAAGATHTVAVKSDGTVVAWGDNDDGQTNVPGGLSGVVQVAAGDYHTVAVKSDGTVVAWGLNGNGQTTVPAGLSGVVQVAAGYRHTVAVKSDGTVVAWGLNGNGQTTVPGGLSGVVQVAAGGNYTVALKSDGTVVAWGRNDFGQTTVPGGLSGIVQVAAGSLHTVALKSDGTVVAWGYNAYGQTVVPAGLSGVVQVVAGRFHTVALKSDGTLVAWGDNLSGQTTVPSGLSGIVQIAAGGYHTVALQSGVQIVAWGNNSYGQRNVPGGLSGVVQVAAGDTHTVALKSDGTLVAWGNNIDGQTTVPSGLSGVVQVAVGRYFTVALKSDGTLVAWGDNFYGQTTVPAGLSGVVQVAAGYYYMAALKSDGTLVAWGDNLSGQTTVPAGLSGVVQIAAGHDHMVALKSDGTLVAWGDNGYGQATVPAGLSGVVQVAAGGLHTVALKGDGTVVAWGYNGYGQTTVPAGLTGVVQIVAGGYHTVALKSDGTVVAWGGNSFGETTVPAGLSGVVQVAAGSYHTVAIARDTVPPDTSITTQPPNPSNTSTASFSFSGSDNVTLAASLTFTCQLDGSAFAACTSPQSYSGLSDGSHTFQVRAIDRDGNVDPSPAAFTWVVDTSRPDTTIISSPTNPTNTTNASFNFSGTDVGGWGVASFACQLDSGAFTACTSSQTYSSLSDGSHTFLVRASNTAGNSDPSPASFTWVVDASPPDTAITSNPTNPTNTPSASFDFSGTDVGGSGVASFACQLDSSAFTACTSPQSYSSLSDGSHTFKVRAIDTAGNLDPSPASFSWAVDTAAPSVVISSITASPTNLASFAVTVSFSEPVSGFTPTVASGDLAIVNGSASNPAGSGTTYTFDLSPTAQGPVTVVVPAGSALDAAGNPNTASNIFSISYDSLSPTVTIDQAVAQADPASTAPINFTVVFAEPVVNFSATDLTFGGTAPGTLSATLSGGPSTYDIAVSGMTGAGTVTASIASGVATDLAGNANAAATSSDNSVAFDSIVPVATGIVRADPNPTSAATVHFTVTFSKSVTGVDASDFTLLPAGVTGATITAVTGSGTTWIVTVTTGAGSGTLGLNLIDDDTIIDAARNPLGGSGSTNGDFSSGEIYTIDKTAPLAGNLAAATISTAGGTTQIFTVIFSDNLAIDSSSLDGSDILVTGPAGFSQLATLVSVTPASDGTPRTATYQIAAAGGSWDTADNGIYTVAVQANQVRDTVGNSAVGSVLGTFSVAISATRYTAYLPLVLNPGTADLVVRFSISPNKRSFVAGEPVDLLVTVTNQGSASAAPFWVDAYINPSSPPTAANQPWNARCALTPCFGLAWQTVSGLAPGQSITLTVQSIAVEYSIWPGWLAAGTSDVYVYVDSWNPPLATGAVAESNESNNRAELHGLSVTGTNPSMLQSQSAAALPTRR